MKFHTSIPAALKHPTVWAGIGTSIASVASSVAGHLQTFLLSLSGACGVVAVILKSPDTVQLENEKDPND